MATWTTGIGALSNNISTDLTAIDGNFTVLSTAWSGDHVALAGTGTSSVNHDKVSLVAQATATPAAGVGIVYCDSSESNDLFFAYPTGGTYATTRITEKGNLASGSADAFASWTSVGGIINNHNIDSISVATTVARYTVTITYALGVFTDTNYTVIESSRSSSGGTILGGIAKTADVGATHATTTLTFYGTNSSSTAGTVVKFTAGSLSNLEIVVFKT